MTNPQFPIVSKEERRTYPITEWTSPNSLVAQTGSQIKPSAKDEDGVNSHWDCGDGFTMDKTAVLFGRMLQNQISQAQIYDLFHSYSLTIGVKYSKFNYIVPGNLKIMVFIEIKHISK